MRALKLNTCSWFVVPLLMVFASCVDTKKAIYFSGQSSATLPAEVTIPDNVITNNDILSITVNSLDPDASRIYNSPNAAYGSTNGYNGSTLQPSGYLVSREGNIQFPVLGTIKVAGLTEEQLRAKIVKSLIDKKLLLDPIVSVRQLNFKVTVLGEVGHPMVINVPNETITLLEALGLAGDITVYGKKDNVMLIRQDGNKKTIVRLDLNSPDFLSSPYYNLLSNDVVYVEPNKAKVATSGRATQLLPIILSGLSFAAIVIDRITRSN